MREVAPQRLHAPLKYLIINGFKVLYHQNNDTADGVSLESPWGATFEVVCPLVIMKSLLCMMTR